jgi:hypothetical protein
MWITKSEIKKPGIYWSRRKSRPKECSLMKWHKDYRGDMISITLRNRHLFIYPDEEFQGPIKPKL